MTAEPELKRTLGPVALVTLGIGAVIGAGIFTLTGVAAATRSGPAIIISFVFAAIGCALAGLCYSEFATLIPKAGSAYTYARETMGEFLGWVIGWDLILEYAVGAATVSIGWSQTLIALLDMLGIHLPPALIASPFQPVVLSNGQTIHGLVNLPAVMIVVLISLLLIRGIQESALANSVMVIVKVSVVLVFIAIGWSYINPANVTPLIPPNTGTFGSFGWSGILRGGGMIFFAYIGFDAVSTAAQEAKRPQRDMPIGILGSLAICTVLFILYSRVLTGIVPYQQLNVAAPLSLALDHIGIRWLTILMNIAVLAGLTSVMLVMMLGQSRVFFAMSRDGLLPKLFSSIHPRFRTPWRSNLMLMIFVSLFSAFAPIAIVGDMTSIGTLLAFVLVSGGIIIMRKTRPGPRPFRTPWVPFIPILSIAVNLLLMVSLGWSNWARLVGWLAIGLLIYFGYGRKHRVKASA
ncbi:MAG: amino acid permease [Acidobacteriota bacterium]|nr:amino acid permease [Acidobacteriota bacterium]